MVVKEKEKKRQKESALTGRAKPPLASSSDSLMALARNDPGLVSRVGWCGDIARLGGRKKRTRERE